MALLAAAAFLIAVPSPGSGQTSDAIDLTAPADTTNCIPCHMTLKETDTPGIVFSHGNHFLVSCDGCHATSVHRDGVTTTPPMELCFNCHGVAHGPAGELATGACEDCHTPAFNLRPATHVSDWAATPHAERAAKDTNQCIMCHDAATDCDPCHRDEQLDIGAMPTLYLSLRPSEVQLPSVKVYPNEPTSMGQCIYCHPDIDDFLPGRIIFAHAKHLRRNYQCTVCHPQFGHGLEGVRRPDMLSCYRCHGLTHSTAGEIATQKCEDCHPADFELKPTDHTAAFEAGKHKERAGTEPEYCAMCHQPAFCVECHMGRKKLATGAKSAKVIPADHKKAEWLSQHGPLYLRQEGACGSCHDAPSCKQCHKTVMPHPVDWLKDHTPDTDVERADCNVCHTNRDTCQNCHHDSVRRAELTAENCTPCHDEMKQEPATGIKHKGFAEHAVHFGVAESKGKPYRCYECHVSFGSSLGQRSAEIATAHDLRLCNQCHGVLDLDGEQVAPYRGKDLCLRCHTDLNV